MKPEAYETSEYEATQFVGWRLYYADGSTFDSSDGPWFVAPDSGVLVLMIYQKKPYKMQIAGFDRYRLPRYKTYKRGVLVDDETFYRVQDRAVNDEEWPD